MAKAATAEKAKKPTKPKKPAVKIDYTVDMTANNDEYDVSDVKLDTAPWNEPTCQVEDVPQPAPMQTPPTTQFGQVHWSAATAVPVTATAQTTRPAAKPGDVVTFQELMGSVR